MSDHAPDTVGIGSDDLNPDDLNTVLGEQLDRALGGLDIPATLRATENGAFPDAAWEAVRALDLALALVPEARGGAGLGWADLGGVFQSLGRHGAPVPLAETVLANHLLARAGLDPVEGVAGVAAVPERFVPWGRHAAVLVRPGTGERIERLGTAGIEWTEGCNIGREPRDTPEAGTAAGAIGALGMDAAEAVLLGGAAIRANQVAGALSAVLATSVDYANTRKQFGRAIGKFQAVQQLLARMAGEVAACAAAAEGALRAIDREGLEGAAFEIAAAKVMAGEAVAVGTEVSHQVFAAMGITDEHPLHLHTRRLWSWRAEFGSDRFWADRLGHSVLSRGGGSLWAHVTGREERE